MTFFKLKLVNVVVLLLCLAALASIKLWPAAAVPIDPHGAYLDSTNLCATCHPVHEAAAVGKQRESEEVRIEEDDTSSISYTGIWTEVNDASASAGSYKKASSTSAAADFAFNGNSISWVALKDSSSGVANVYLDGNFMASFDLYNTTPTYQVTVFSNLIGNGDHTLTIEPSGTKNASSTGYNVAVDAFNFQRRKIMLLNQTDEKAICYTCHNGTGGLPLEQNFIENGAPTSTVSEHPVADGRVLCSGCHSPHREVETSTTATPNAVVRLVRALFSSFIGYITNENPTWLPVAANNSYGIPKQIRLDIPYQQCGACHGEGSKLPGGDLLKYYDQNGIAHDSTANLPPNAKTKIACLTCHNWHSSTLPKLLETTIAGSPVAANDNSVCYACHVETKITRYNETSPTGDIHGVNESTKTPGSGGLKAPYDWRQPQIDCKVCHNPHGTANVYWIPKQVNGNAVTLESTTATDKAQMQNFCDSCHIFTHENTSTYDQCLSCHFHGANADTDTTTTF